MENLPTNIEEKIENLPKVSFDQTEELQKVIVSEDFTTIFNFYKQNYLPDILKSKPEIYQRVSLYLTLTNQDNEFLEQTNQVLYKRPCPDIDTFLSSKQYMHYSNATLYPFWKEQLHLIFKQNSPIRKVIFSGCLGCGKSTVARKAFIYVLYRILCLRYPRAVFNIDNDATIANVVIATTLRQVYEVNMLPFVKLMESMPCFQRVLSQRSFDNFDLNNPTCPIPFVLEKSTGTVYFPDNIILTSGSSSNHFTGMNVVNSFCDEINDHSSIDGAIALLNTLDNRFASRFQGSDLVFQSIVSSARTTNSALGEYVRHLPKDDPSILKLNPMLWEVKPDPNFVGDGTTFPVMVGNGSVPSKIITNPGELKAIEDNKYEPPAGCEIIHVPTVYRTKFELQLDQSIQDIAGMTTSDNNMVFRDTAALEDSVLNPEFYLEVNIKDNTSILDLLERYDLFEKNLSGKWQFKRAPGADRYCFTEDTKVSTLDGKEKTMKELTDDFNHGINNWVYSWSNEHGWSIGKIAFAGITSKGTKICKITLDNGEEIKCTPNHKFMLRNGNYIEAQHLTPDTSLMPLYRQKAKIVSYKAKMYEQIKDNRTGKYKFTHTISSDVFAENKEQALNKAKKLNSFIVRHHKDFNAANNNPDNLIYLESKEHFNLHSVKGYDHFTALWKNPEFRKKMQKVSSENGKINGKKDMINKWHGPNNKEWREYLKPIQAEHGRKNFCKYNKSEKHRKVARDVLTKQRKNPEFNKKAIIGRILKKAKLMIEKNIPLTPENWDTLTQKDYSQNITYKTTLKYVKDIDEIKQLLKDYNHKVKKIEFITLEEPINLYDLTIEDQYNCHNFSLSAGVVVSNCHIDLSSGGEGGQCDSGVCIGHKEWRLNENTGQKETIYVVDLLLAINAKNKIDIHAIQTFLTDLVIEKNIPIHTISADQYQSLMFLQSLEASGCFTKVEKVSVDIKLEPYMNAASLIELGQVKVGKCPKLKRELEALVLSKGKVTRTTELKDLADALVGFIWDAQLNYQDEPQYQYLSHEEIKEKTVNYDNLINTETEEFADLW